MAVKRASDGGTLSTDYNSARLLRSDEWLEIDEGASTGSFTTVSNPFGDGFNYRQVTITSSGNIVVAKQGICTALLVGGGGGGGTYYANGGAGGQVLVKNKLFLPAGTHPVTIGGGGSAGQAGSAGNGGATKIADVWAVGGGYGAWVAKSSGDGAHGGGIGFNGVPGGSCIGGYSGGTVGPYAGAAGAGAGGNASGNTPGAGLQVWGTYYAAGARSGSGGGTGWSGSGYGMGGPSSVAGRPGIVILRYRIS